MIEDAEDNKNVYKYENNLSQGVEEEVNEVVESSDIGAINDAIIVAIDWTLETLYQQIRKGNIDLNPHFQRRDVWSDSKKSKLIESILINIPIPHLLFAEKKRSKK